MKQFFSKKVITTILAVLILLGGVFFLSQNFVSQNDGNIIVDVVDIDGKKVAEKEISFQEGDQLVDLIQDHFKNVSIENGMIMDIETLKTPSDWSEFICIYVDEKMSDVGIQDIEFHDGTHISLIMSENNYGQ